MDEIKITTFNAPSLEQIIFRYLGEAIESHDVLAKVFDNNFTKNYNQRLLAELLETCEVPADEHLHILLYGGVGCLDGDTHIPYVIKRPDGSTANWKGGSFSRLHERFHRISTGGKGKNRIVPSDHTFHISSVDESTGIFFLNKVENVIDSGFKETFEVVLEGGRSLIATSNHPFLTREGYVKLEDLNIGDMVAVHRNTRTSKGRAPRKLRQYVFVKYHPVAGIKWVDKYRYHRLSKSRALVEASMNGMTLEEYLFRLNCGALQGLKFLERSQNVHHLDGNCQNDVLSNLQVLSKEEHDRLHNEEEEVSRVAFYVTFEPIHSIIGRGVRHVYDVTMSSPTPNFVADGFVVHNSGKTWAALQHTLDLMLKYSGTRALAVRRTSSDLDQSIYRETLEFLSAYGVPYKKNDKDHMVKLPNNSFIYMRSDKSLVQADKSKSDALGSQQFSIAILEEADSISEELAKTIPGRLRQKIPGFRKVIMYICNPPGRNHWLYRKFFKEHDPFDPKSHYRAIQMDMEGNKEHLDPGYIRSVTRDYADDPAMYARLRKGNFAPDTKGDPIYQKYFNRDVHVSKVPLEWNPKFPVCRLWDFGFRGMPCVYLQDDLDRRQLRFLGVNYKERIMFESFCDQVIQETWSKFPGCTNRDFVDPAGRQQTATGLTYHDIMKKKGMNPQYFIHQIAYGINLVAAQLQLMSYRENEDLRETFVKPAILIDPSCDMIIECLETGYCNKKDAPKDVIDPVKDGFYDHVADAIRYGMVMLRRANQKNQPNPSPVRGYYETLDQGQGVQMPSRKKASNRYGRSRMRDR